ncbi:MAG: oligosaccharide flippase family protein [Methanomassiliicoccus sp.]|nr:oligosaccharide flippase family protein [Methanomassiliicoccus sp.]
MARTFENHIVESVRTRLSAFNPLNLYRDRLYRNSLFIILASIAGSCLGLLFWVIAAHYYSIGDIGLASTLISTSSLISTVAGLGLDQAMIRYFPSRDKSRIFGTALQANLLFSVVLGVVFVLGASIWMPDLVTDPSYRILFVVLTCVMSVSGIISTSFIGSRMAKYVLIMTLLLGLRVPLLIPFVPLGSMGVLASLVLVYVLMFGVCAIFLYRMGIRLGKFDWAYFKESFWFSTGNYVGNILYSLPTLVSPIIIYSMIGSSEAAIYYMSLSVTAIVFYVPSSFSTSLFVEGSHGESLGKIFKKSLMVIYAILIPLVLLIICLGPWILGILGEEYAAQGPIILDLLVISSLFLAPYLAESTALKIRGKVRGLIILSAINAISFFALLLALVSLYGMDGIGMAWIGSFAICTVVGYVMVRD